MDHKDDIMVTVTNKAGRTLRVPIQYAQKAINSGTEEIIKKVEPGYGKRLTDEYLERLRNRRQNISDTETER